MGKTYRKNSDSFERKKKFDKNRPFGRDEEEYA